MSNAIRFIAFALSQPRAICPGQGQPCASAPDARPYGLSGRLISAPWWGLYIEEDR